MKNPYTIKRTDGYDEWQVRDPDGDLIKTFDTYDQALRFLGEYVQLWTSVIMQAKCAVCGVRYKQKVLNRSHRGFTCDEHTHWNVCDAGHKFSSQTPNNGTCPIDKCGAEFEPE